MIAAKPYTIWNCCEFDHEHTLDDALSWAYNLDSGDYHQWLSIECPDGTVITHESPVFRQYSIERRDADAQRRNAAAAAEAATPMGWVELQDPACEGWRFERCRLEDQDELAEKYRAWYGPDRVRTGR